MDKQKSTQQQVTKIMADPESTTSQRLLHRETFKTERSRHTIIATFKWLLFCEK